MMSGKDLVWDDVQKTSGPNPQCMKGPKRVRQKSNHTRGKINHFLSS